MAVFDVWWSMGNGSRSHHCDFGVGWRLSVLTGTVNRVISLAFIREERVGFGIGVGMINP